MRTDVRLATARDVAALPEIERDAASLFVGVLADVGLTRDALGHVRSVESLDEARQAGRLWIAADGAGEPVGFAMAVELGGYAHLDELAVRPLHGRRGLGGALLEAVCEWARGAGYAAVTLSTFRDVPWNRPFYEKHGFRPTAPSELSAAHVQLVADEEQRGLRGDLRVLMSRDVGPAIRGAS